MCLFLDIYIYKNVASRLKERTPQTSIVINEEAKRYPHRKVCQR